jgi:tetratricopeptide (TPR) repeat protein
MSVLTISEQIRHVQADGSGDWSLSWAQRCVVAGKALWFYAIQLLWPHNLAFIYPHWEIRADTVTGWLPLAAVLFLGAVLYQLRQHPWARHGLFGLGCFALALLPVLGFFDVYYFRFSFVADHFNYLGSAALLALTAAGVATFVRQRVPQVALATCALLIFSVFSWQRVRVFHSDEELWRDTLRKNPDSFLAHNNLGTILREKEQYDQAIAHWREASRISPNAWQPYMNSAKLFLDTGQYDKAVVEFREALRLKSEAVEPRYGLGMTYSKLGQYDKARTEFKETLRTKPDEGKVYYWLGEIDEREGHANEAIQDYLLAIRYDSTLADAYVNLGLLRQKQGELDRAINCFRTAVRLRPDDNRAHDALIAAEKLRQRGFGE